jgi:hypothetical protein
MRTALAAGLALIGLVLLAVSFLVPPSGNGGWTDEKAARYAEVNQTLFAMHYAGQDHGHSHGVVDPDLGTKDQLEAERAVLSAELTAAQDARSRWPNIAFVVGIIALVGALGVGVIEAASGE